MTRYIAYSMASCNALAEGETIEEARTRADGDPDFLVVASVRTTAPLHHLDILPADAAIMWRGQNPLAQRYRA